MRNGTTGLWVFAASIALGSVTPGVAAQDAPLLAIANIAVFRAPDRNEAADEALSASLQQLVAAELIKRGLPFAPALADANIAVMTNYAQIGDNARLEVILVRRPDRRGIARRVTTPNPPEGADALAELIAIEIDSAFKERERGAAR